MSRSADRPGRTGPGHGDGVGSVAGAGAERRSPARDEEASALRPRAVHAAGSRALLVDYPDTAAVLAAADAVRAHPPRGLVDLVPAERTLLLALADPLDVPAARAAVASLRPAPASAAQAAATVEIPVVYDGEDLAELASLLGRTAEALVAAHTGERWTAAFGGFAPGFAYLLPAGAGLGEVPRRTEPRRRVPAGSVALASRYSGVYPRESPGGWQLIGRTDAPLWTPEREESPALLSPGTRVRFRAVRALSRLLPPLPRPAADGSALPGPGPSEPGPSAPGRSVPGRSVPGRSVPGRSVPGRSVQGPSEPGPSAPGRSLPGIGRILARPEGQAASAGDAALRVLHPGPLLLVQDTGRPGRAALGVGRSGAADRGALLRADLAVGNPPGAAALELLLGPASLQAVRPVVLAVAGAAAEVTVHRAARAPEGDGEAATLPPLPVPAERAVALDPGDRLEIGALRQGLRLVIAVRGGVPAPGGPVLGSHARDTLSHLGPAPLAAGDVLAVGPTRGLDAVPDPRSGIAEQAPASTRSAAPPLPDAQRGATAPPPGRDGPASDEVVLPVVLGPRDALLGSAAVAALLGRTWRVRPDSDRVGVRLDGDPLEVPAGTGTLPSEAIVPGSVQVPPSGLPVVFGRDHPATGGYPVIAVVEEAGLDLLAQAAPGTTVRFTAL